MSERPLVERRRAWLFVIRPEDEPLGDGVPKFGLAVPERLPSEDCPRDVGVGLQLGRPKWGSWRSVHPEPPGLPQRLGLPEMTLCRV